MGTVVGCLTIEVFISEAQSLKDKRRVLRRIKDRVRQKFNVGIAETGGQDLWQSAELAIVAVANESQHVDRTLASVADWMDQESGFVVSGRQLEWR